MPSLIDIRRRIRSVKNTQQITKAMKMVSAARLRRAQDRVISSRPYAGMLRELLSNVAAAAAADERVSSHPLLAQREGNRIQLILVTADRGLAGAFNTNLIKGAQQFIEEHQGASIEMELIGRKGRDFFSKRGAVVSGEAVGNTEKVTYDDAKSLAQRMMQRYRDNEIDSVWVIYNEFKSVIAQRLTVSRVLPVTMPAGAATAAEYLFEQSPLELLESLLPRYVEIEIYRALLESAAAQQAARMTAMEAATTNAGEMIDRLTLFMNRVRQASITREIIEVVSGASALE